MGFYDGSMGSNGIYPLVNEQFANWKDPPFFSWVNQLFLRAIFNSKLGKCNDLTIISGDGGIFIDK